MATRDSSSSRMIFFGPFVFFLSFFLSFSPIAIPSDAQYCVLECARWHGHRRARDLWPGRVCRSIQGTFLFAFVLLVYSIFRVRLFVLLYFTLLSWPRSVLFRSCHRLTAQTVEEAVEKANKTEYGLAAAVFSKDINKCLAVSMPMFVCFFVC
jgi:hypothetical protein